MRFPEEVLKRTKREIIVNTQFLKLNVSYYLIFLKNVTNYLSNSITYIVISCGNSLSYQKHVQIIHELARNSITLKVWVFIFNTL